MIPILIATSSKFRLRILKSATPPIPVARTLSPDIDEKNVIDRSTNPNDADTVCLAVAKAKNDAVLRILEAEKPFEERTEDEHYLVVTLDQVVSYKGVVREKPTDVEECRRFLRSYRDDVPAETHSAIVVTNTATRATVSGIDVARQYFQPVPESVIDALIEKGDVMWCCGGFLIDDPIIYPYLARRDGDEDSIIGMPVKLLRKLLEEASEP
ncbi:inosine triphosphate pyrophosphatase-like protein [Gaertneriomyces semiglobifer]|nr:inosine triphosphate pyrophosphatase-like protein [Gaertneriomyces semiglobifer]